MILRSEPSSRAALMGEQPNPWDLLRPQDATSRHRAISHITAGADYIFTLPRLRVWARGQRLMTAIDLSAQWRTERAISRSGVSDRSVVTGSSQETCTHAFALQRIGPSPSSAPIDESVLNS